MLKSKILAIEAEAKAKKDVVGETTPWPVPIYHQLKTAGKSFMSIARWIWSR